MGVGIDGGKRDVRLPEGIAPARDRVAVAVPARVHGDAALSVADDDAVIVPGGVAVRIVGVAEHIAGVVEDDVEDDADAVGMRCLHQIDEILARTEVGIDIQKVLDAVAMIGVGVRAHLLERRADPDGGDAQALQIADLARKACQRAAQPFVSRIRPWLTRSGVSVGGEIERRGRSRRYGLAGVVAKPLFPSVGVAVQHQEVEHLIRPACGRGRVGALSEGRPLDIREAPFDPIVRGVVDHGVFLRQGGRAYCVMVVSETVWGE